MAQGISRKEWLNRLEFAKFKLCRPQNRSSYWKSDKNNNRVASSNGARGRFVSELLKWHKGSVDATSKLTQSELANQINKKRVSKIGPAPFSKFLNGKPSESIDWKTIGTLAAKLILDSYSQWLESKIDSTNCDGDCAESIEKGKGLLEDTVSYFFPGNEDDEPDFFSEDLKSHDAVASIREVIYELDYLRFCASELGAKCRIIRTSGRERFLQINTPLDALTRTGNATVKCLESGIQTYFVYPESTSELHAKTSAEKFREIATSKLSKESSRNLKLKVLDLKLSDPSFRWSGEFISKMFRWSGYEIRFPDGSTERSLIVNRKAKHGLNPFVPDESETNLFFEWVNIFIETFQQE